MIIPAITGYVILQIIFLFRIRCVAKDGELWPRHRLAFWLLFVLYLACASIPVLGTFLPDTTNWKFIAMARGNNFVGFMIYLMLPLVFTDVLLWLFSLIKMIFTRKWKAKYPKVLARLLLVLLPVCSVACYSWGYYLSHKPVVTHWDMDIDKDAGDIETLHAVLIADLHMSCNSTPDLFVDMVEKVNAQNPDVIFISGDWFTSSYDSLKNPDLYIYVLKQLKAKYGVYTIYGNHDTAEDLFCGFPVTPVTEAFRDPRMTEFMEATGATILDDETTTIADGAIQIVGRKDAQKPGNGSLDRMSAADLTKDLDQSKPIIIMQHGPADSKAMAEAGGDVCLSGHTHNGQTWPGQYPIILFNENDYGYRVVDGLANFTTAGVGFYGPPIRVGNLSEIMVIDFHFNS